MILLGDTAKRLDKAREWLSEDETLATRISKSRKKWWWLDSEHVPSSDHVDVDALTLTRLTSSTRRCL